MGKYGQGEPEKVFTQYTSPMWIFVFSSFDVVWSIKELINDIFHSNKYDP